MKVSYNILKNYKKDLKIPEELANDFLMHVAEIEDIIYEGKQFDNVIIGEIKKINNHPDADKLKVCSVDIGGENTQIVCGGTNLYIGQKVAVAKIGASVLWHGEGEPVILKKTKIRGVESNGMICAADEIGLKYDFEQKSTTEILDLSFLDFKNGTNLAKALNKDDIILEIDNKAINHRPDLFSYIGIIREIYAIYGEKFDYEYKNKDFSGLKELGVKNLIPEFVKRYIGLKILNLGNIETPNYIKNILKSAGISSKGLLVDLSNYSLYLYGQPTHIFDADKIKGDIEIRFAKNGEKFLALDDKEYILNDTDIVIADKEKILALAGIIGAKNSGVTNETKNIIIEGANFDNAKLRATGKKLGIRTDALNIFEKDLLPIFAKYGVSLIVDELEKYFSNMKLDSYSDKYNVKQKSIKINYDINFINKLIGKDYSKDLIEQIFYNLGIEIKENDLIIPSWRKDLKFKADIAEEIARIDGYDKIKPQVPKIELGAIIQDNICKLKNKARHFFVENGFFDMYTYSFVNDKLMQKCNSSIKNLVSLKNFLSEDATHMKNSLIPNLLLSLEKNRVDFYNLRLFEIEKVFKLKGNDVSEYYSLAGLYSEKKDIIYYDLQNIFRKFLERIGIKEYEFKETKNPFDFAHKKRTADIIVRGKNIGQLGEIKPRVLHNFELKENVGFFEINLNILAQMLGKVLKVKSLSEFQGSSFDISFVLPKDISSKKLHKLLEKIDSKIVKKVELFDIYENEEKIPGKRSFSYKIFIQNIDSEITDKQKNELIEKIIKKAETIGAKLR